MQERHPIDEQFRKVLANAEAIPPPSVWAGIAAAQRRRRRAAFWRWSSLAGLAVLGGVAIGTALFQNDAPASDPLASTVEAAAPSATSGPATSNVPAAPEQHPVAPTTASAGEAVPSSTNTTATTTERAEAGASAKNAARQERSGSRSGNSADGPTRKASEPSASMPSLLSVQAGATRPVPLADADGPSTHTKASGPGTTPSAETSVALPLPPLEATRMERDALGRMGTVWNRSPWSTAPHQVDVPEYRVPHGDWWIGLVAGSMQGRTRWQGSDAELADALEDGEGVLGQFVWGAAVGRQWRSGFGVSTGFMTDRTEREFRHVDVERTTTEEVQSHYVTLNNLVFLSDVDTILTTSTRESITRGVDRRSTLRIPVLGHWRSEWRRWSLGARLGVALELTRAEAGPAITRIADGAISAAFLSASERTARYPTTLLGVLGADLGYRLHEHWSIEAGYLAMPGALTLSEQAPVHAVTSRHGAEFRLILHLPTRP